MRRETKAFYSGTKEEPIEEVKEELPKKAGVCWNCGYGSWTMKTIKGVFYRKCKKCGEDQEPIE